MTDLSKLPGITDYQHLIFVQLDCKDLLQCAKVSKSWNRMIGQFLHQRLTKSLKILIQIHITGVSNLHENYEKWNNILTAAATFQESFKYNNEKAKIVHHLLEYKSPMNWTLSENNSILHFACSLGITKLVQYLFNSIQELGINVNARNRIRRTAFLCACRNGHKDIVEIFLAHRANMEIDVNDFDHFEQTPFISAAMNGHHEVVKLLLQSPGVDVNAIDSLRRTAFIWACLNGNVEVVKVIIEFAIEKNIDLNRADNTYRSGYINACFYTSDNRRKISNILRENAERIGLDLNFRDLTGKTGDYWRIRHERNNEMHPKTTTFVCTNDCCLSFNPYPKNFPMTSAKARQQDREDARRNARRLRQAWMVQ